MFSITEVIIEQNIQIYVKNAKMVRLDFIMEFALEILVQVILIVPQLHPSVIQLHINVDLQIVWIQDILVM